MGDFNLDATMGDRQDYNYKQQGIMLSVERRYLYPQGSRSYRRGPSPREKASGNKKKKMWFWDHQGPNNIKFVKFQNVGSDQNDSLNFKKKWKNIENLLCAHTSCDKHKSLSSKFEEVGPVSGLPLTTINLDW